MAGAFAVVGTTAIAIAPTAQQSLALEQLKPLHTAAVEMTAFANPFNAILGSLDLVNNDLFNGFETYPGDIPQGLFPQLLDDPLPVAREFGDNLSYYLGNAIAALVTGPTSSANVFVTAVWTLPSQLGEAFTELISGDFQGALETLADTFIAPIPYIIDGFVNAISVPVVNVFQHAVNLLTAIPGIAVGGINTLVDGTALVGGLALGVVTDIVSNLFALDFEGAWNAGVNGLLGPGGVAGLVEQLTLGPGYTDPESDTFFNSIRGWATEAQNTVRVAISSVAGPSDEEETAAPATAVAPSAAKVAAAAAEDSSKDASSVADGAKAAAAGDDSAAASAPAATSSEDSAPAGDSKADAKADNGGKTGAGTAKSGGKGHGKSHGSARKAADN
jgi:hypothetical protein